MKVYKKKDKIIFEVDFLSKRFNPYMPDEDVGKYPTLTGLIYYDKSGNEEIGFAYTIDMSYKGKDDQWTAIMIDYGGEIEDFKKLCSKLGITCVDARDIEDVDKECRDWVEKK